MMSMCVRYAGDSYTYLLDSVATDHGRPAATGSVMARYYSANGTPPGTWLGNGLAHLNNGAGVAQNSFVTPLHMERLFANGEDPTSGKALGRSPHVYSETDVRRRPVAGFDCTFTVPKSVSVLWALADSETREAIYECHRQAIADVIGVIERDVARTRMGTNGVAQVEVSGVIAAAFDHWDSRQNDPNLHSHVVIANRAQGPDGRWRTLDSRALHRAAVAMSERYDTLLADHLSTRLGLEWEYRERGPQRNPAFELAAVPPVLLDEFSRRSTAIDVETDRLVDQYVTDHGRRPHGATIIRLRQQATLATRGPKEVYSLDELTSQWKARARELGGAVAAQWMNRALTRGSYERATVSADRPAMVGDAATAVLNVLTRKRSTWSPWNIDAEASRALKAYRFETAAERDNAVAAVVAEVQSRSVLLTPAEAAPTPASLRRSDGSSALRPHRVERYTSQTTLDAEDRLLVASRDHTGPTARHWSLATTDLVYDQLTAAEQILTFGRALDVMVGPAGSGKTRTLAAIRTAWEKDHGDGSVVGLAPSAAAAEVLGSALGIPTENTAKWLVEHAATPERLQRLARAEAALPRATSREAAREMAGHIRRLTEELEQWRFKPGQLVIIDEATLASTVDLDRIVAAAGEAGSKVLLVGDWAQLSAVDAGGAFGLVVRDLGTSAPELEGSRRFREDWEAEAAGLLRVGDTAAIEKYERDGRIHGGAREAMIASAYAAWVADETAGKRSLLLAGDTDTVRDLNERARSDLIAMRRVTAEGTTLRDGLTAGVGDRIVTRRLDRRLMVGERWVKNGDAWNVTDRHRDGSLTVRRPGGGPSVTLPAAYVREHVELGYATTAYRAQGSTVDTAHAIVTGRGLTREVLYVMMTRARESNRAYVCTDPPVGPLDGFEHVPATAREVLSSVLDNVGASLSAHETARDERERVASIRTLAAEYETIANQALMPRWMELLARSGLPDARVREIADSPAFGALGAALRRAEAYGLPLQAALPRLVDRVEAGAGDVAAVLHERLDRWADGPGHRRNFQPDNLVLGMIPKARVDDPEVAAALEQRVRLMEARADELIERAQIARSEWFRGLGTEPGDRGEAVRWRSAARAAVAYRERHQITDPYNLRGSLDYRTKQQERESHAVGDTDGHRYRSRGVAHQPAIPQRPEPRDVF